MLSSNPSGSGYGLSVIKKSKHDLIPFETLDEAEKYVFDGHLFTHDRLQGLLADQTKFSILLSHAATTIMERTRRYGPHTVVYNPEHHEFFKNNMNENNIVKDLKMSFYGTENISKNNILVLHCLYRVHPTDKGLDDSVWWINIDQHVLPMYMKLQQRKGIIIQPNIEDYGIMIQIGENE